jgi:hypothetical protein
MGSVQDDLDFLAEPIVRLAPGPFAVSVLDHPRTCYLCGLRQTTSTDAMGRAPVCESCLPLLRQPIALGNVT